MHGLPQSKMAQIPVLIFLLPHRPAARNFRRRCRCRLGFRITPPDGHRGVEIPYLNLGFQKLFVAGFLTFSRILSTSVFSSTFEFGVFGCRFALLLFLAFNAFSKKTLWSVPKKRQEHVTDNS
jgi:hypothetical protein